MTLLWCDGFEGYGTTNNVDPDPAGIVAEKYGYVNNEDSFLNRTGSVARDDWYFYLSYIPYSVVMRTPDITSNATVIAGVAFYPYNITGYTETFNWPLFNFKNSSGETCAELLVANGTLFVWGIDDTYLGGARVQLDRRNWSYIEMKVYAHATNGTIEVRVNGCPVINLSSVNTINASGATTKVGIGDLHPIGTTYYSGVEDFYVCDGAGSKNNDFLGDVTVKTIFPNGDDSVGFSATGNVSYATNWEQTGCQESLPTTDWVMEDTTGNRDIYTLDNPTNNFYAIHGVIGWANARYEATSTTYRMVCDSNGTETESANITPSSGANFQTDLFVVENDPDISNAWTNSTINAMKFGYEVQ